MLYQNIYNENLFSDFILLEDAPSLCVELGLITNQYEQQIKYFDKKIENAKVEYFLQYADIGKRKRLFSKLQTLKKQYGQYLEKLHYLDHLSLEHHCNKLKNEFIITHTLYYFNTQTLVFTNPDDIDYIIFNSIMHELNKNVLDVDDYKNICKSEYWKNLSSNDIHFLISEPLSEWSEEQKTLYNISMMYKRIYEHPECPSDDIIQDNDALDGWMIHQKRENIKQKQEKGVNNILSDKVRNSSEIFLLAKNKEEADNIIDFNDNQGKHILQQKINLVQSSEGPIKECRLPDVQQKIQTQRRNIQTRK